MSLLSEQASITLHMNSSVSEIAFDGTFGTAALRAYSHAKSLGWLRTGSAMTVSGGIKSERNDNIKSIELKPPTITRTEFNLLNEQEDVVSKAVCWAINLLGASIVD